MKYIYTFLVLFLFTAVLSAQSVYLTTDFSGTFPPAGWTIDAQAGNWSANNSNNAGGVAPEARFNYSPTFTGDSRLISPAVDLTGVTALKVKFRHMLDHFGGPYTIGVATRSGGGDWNIVWSVVNPSASIPGTQEVVTINNGDVGASDFQICWYFSGYSYNLNYWYIDDISLFTPYPHDAMVKSIDVDNQYVPGTTFTPKATLNNFGLNSETFDATCTIKIGGSTIYEENCLAVTLAPDEEQQVSFPDYTAAAAEELFEITVKTNLAGDMDPGNDTISKWFNTYTTPRDMVLVEIGTGTWCPYCPGAALGADDLIANGCSVAVIENHNQDDFSYAGSDARNNYYSVPGFPTAIFDGQQQFIGGDHTQSMYQYYLPIYESCVGVNSAYTIGIYGDYSGSDYNLTVRVHKIATTPAYNNIVLQLALTESEIMYNWQGQDHLNYVSRTMAPDANGTPLDFSSGDIQDINLSFTMDADWVAENCELVAFIQNNDDKEILQGSKLPLSELVPLAVKSGIGIPYHYSLSQNFPNPFNPTTTIKYTVPENGPVTIKLYDITGSEVATLVNEVKSVGSYDLKVDASRLSSGVYIYRMIAKDFVSVKKMSILK